MCADGSHGEKLADLEWRLKALEADQEVVAEAAALAAELLGLPTLAALVRARPVEVVEHRAA